MLNTIPVIAVFDIGKTHKKCLLFNSGYTVEWETQVKFSETTDDDGFPCDNLEALSAWVRETIRELLQMSRFRIEAINFSAYGASWVYIDALGQPVTPLYNYLKPYPADLQASFYDKYGGALAFSVRTASPVLGSLNSGLQLYRLKNEKPEAFSKIQYALHLPQYISYLITGVPCTDITSIGCHTGLWDFPAHRYHEWVEKEGLMDVMAPLLTQREPVVLRFNGRSVPAGGGLHDSSAALVPYLRCFSEPFVLISTGTWCVSLNPFHPDALTEEELQQDCLCYLDFLGRPVKASRLFAGYEHEEQVKRLAEHFNQAPDFYRSLQYDQSLADKIHANAVNGKVLTGVHPSAFGNRSLDNFPDIVTAYYQLVRDLIQQQVYATGLVCRDEPRIFVDGGFASNDVYMSMLAEAFSGKQVLASSVAQASALGAALVLHDYWNPGPIPETLIRLKYY